MAIANSLRKQSHCPLGIQEVAKQRPRRLYLVVSSLSEFGVVEECEQTLMGTPSRVRRH
jgi:hypothetical protein